MDLGDFLVQIPSGLILMVCGSGFLFVISVLIIIQRQNRRKVRKNSPVLSSAPNLEADVEAAQAAPNPANAEPGLLSRTWKSVHDFFFYSEEEKAARERAKTQSAPQAEPPAPQFNAPPDTAEVLHLWRDVVDGELIIQIGDGYFRTMGDITAAGQERRFMAVLRELARIAKETTGEVSAPPPTPAPPAAIPQVAEVDAEIAAPVDDIPADDEEPRPEPPPSPEVAALIKAAQQEMARPSLTSDVQAPSAEPEPEPLGSFFSNVRNAVRRGGRAPVKGPEAPALSIADEIEEFLQNRLRGASTELQNRRIHVRPALDGGVRIEVDGHFFEAVGDIQDEHVRTFVIDSIQAWESSR